MAGTVKPWISPRPRAAYRSWMLADCASSAWLASQTSQRAALDRGLVGARRRRPREVARAALAERGFVLDDQRDRRRRGRGRQEAEEFGDRGCDGGHWRTPVRRAVVTFSRSTMVSRRRPTGGRNQNCGLTTIRNTITHEQDVRMIPSRWISSTSPRAPAADPGAPHGGPPPQAGRPGGRGAARAARRQRDHLPHQRPLQDDRDRTSR